MNTQTYRVYQCPGCNEGTEKPVGWKGVFCSEDCKQDAHTVRTLRKEIGEERPSAGARAMQAVWEEMMRFNVDPAVALPPRSSALYLRVFFPVPMLPADEEDWPSVWQSWKTKRSVGEPFEAYDFSS